MSNRGDGFEHVPLSQLRDQQNAILNKLAYIDLPGGWKSGQSLVELVNQKNPKLAEEMKNAGLGHLVIKDYTNNNVNGSKSGFCAVAFQDPKTGETGMSFRGTEGMDDLLHNPKDMADNTLTMSIGVSPQSLEAIAFFEKNEDKSGQNYLFGHSKGGELAAEVYATNYDNVLGVHIINPQPINPYKLSPDQLAALQSKKFDAVVINGDVVAWLGKTPYPVRYVENNGSQEGFFGPHSIDAMKIDDRGYAVIERDPFSGYFWQGVSAAVATVLLSGIQNKLRIYSFAINTVVRVGNFLINDLPDMVRQFVQYMKQAIERFTAISRAVKDALIEFVGSLVKGVSLLFKLTFNAGYRYASANPLIKVDTYKLRNYADRLDGINRRISSLDHRLDSLYLKAGFSDLWNLLQADLLTEENWNIKKVIYYLNETADDFETVERKIINQL
jgi:hypothetical protein